MSIKNFFFRLTHWESWHYMVKYIPITPVWAWHCFRARSLWFFTPSNPSISFGGFEGETKSEMYSQLPNGTYPKGTVIKARSAPAALPGIVLANNLNFPFIAKPDAGMMGLMFRRIDSLTALEKYHAAMPIDYIIQELIQYPLEVSVFYYRYPDKKKGKITGFLKKEFLEVTGDGTSSLLDLLNNYERVRFRLEEMKAKHTDHLGMILPAGEIYILSHALNLSRGGRLISLAHENDDRLLAVFDQLSHHAGHFYYGRYDIKCASVESLKQAKDFYILEYNGCGAEPHHAYGNNNSLFQAYRIFLHHWKVLAEISQYNHKNGFPRWSFKRGKDFLKKGKENYRLIKKLDACTKL